MAGKEWKAALTSQSSRLKMVEAAQARWTDPEFRARGIAQLRAITTDPEVRKKTGSASKARWADPVMRAKIIAGMKAAKRRKRSGTREQSIAPVQERRNIF